MNIESIFVGYIPLEEKLMSYGFNKTKEGYIYKRDYDFQFSIHILLKGDKVKVDVIDNYFDGDIYIGWIDPEEKMSEDFIGSKISAYIKELLFDIRKNCFIKDNSKISQIDRINELIRSYFKIDISYPFKDYPTYYAYRCKKNDKWFCLFMDVKREKLVPDSDKRIVEVINLKADKDEISSGKIFIDSIYPAYHMSKKNWISIILDDTLKDDVIFSYIKDSYRLVEESK